MQVFGTKTVATVQPRKHIAITYPAAREELLGVPVVLPTSEPGSPQVSYTIETGDLPTLTGIDANQVVYTAMVYVAGQLTGDTVISASAYLNGDFLGTNDSLITDSAQWTYSIFRFYDVHVGDVLTAALWSNIPDTTLYDYTGLTVFVTGMAVAGGAVMLAQSFQVSSKPTLTLGTPEVNSTGDMWIPGVQGRLSDLSTNDFLAIGAPDYEPYVYLLQFGDRFKAMTCTGSANRPVYNVNLVPRDIVYYPTSIRVV